MSCGGANENCSSIEPVSSASSVVSKMSTLEDMRKGIDSALQGVQSTSGFVAKARRNLEAISKKGGELRGVLKKKNELMSK